MTDHPEQPKPSLVERLEKAIDWHPNLSGPYSRERSVLRELVTYLREMPEERGAQAMFEDDEKARRATTGIPPMSWDEVGETFRSTWRQRFRSAKTFLADHLEKEAGNG